MEKDDLMPQKSFGLLKSIAKERSKNKGNRGVVTSSSSLPLGILDYVDLPTVDEELEKKKRKSRRRVCHPVVIIGLVTTILYIIFMTFLIGYFHDPKIKEVLDSLKRLANIKEWLRIIFKPWYNSGGKGGGGERGKHVDVDVEYEEPPNVGPHLNPEFDVTVK